VPGKIENKRCFQDLVLSLTVELWQGHLQAGLDTRSSEQAPSSVINSYKIIL